MIESTEAYQHTVRTLFKTLRQKRSAHLTAKRERARAHSPDFTPFEYIWADERMLSRILADLLDPHGVHGQGDAFYQALCRLLDPLDLPRQAPRRVKTEWRTDHLDNRLRSIDIVLVFEPTYAIGIENKPWADDQPNQVRDYQHDLNAEFGGRYTLLYLTPRGTRPSAYSLGIDGVDEARLAPISYQTHIARWLDACIDVCASERVRRFLADFRAHVQAGPQSPSLNGGSDA